jgi:2-oxo-4-hydroxy-4-carboxy--5-ureidoimidazoline (OHCU) decarboxylase
MALNRLDQTTADEIADAVEEIERLAGKRVGQGRRLRLAPF